jgi:hypothetical protein
MVPPPEFIPLAEDSGLFIPSANGFCARPAARRRPGSSHCVSPVNFSFRTSSWRAARDRACRRPARSRDHEGCPDRRFQDQDRPAFIANLERSPQSAAIIRAVIGLGRRLELPIVAEHVENDAQLAFPAREECSEVEGISSAAPNRSRATPGSSAGGWRYPACRRKCLRTQAVPHRECNPRASAHR